jgi:sterol desaturase/sphingolipid hydroxylase (fatty acid hydroxylase superfamily)
VSAPIAPVDALPVAPNPARRFGTGWISGTLSVALAAVGLFAVLCFHFPAFLTVPNLREHYPVPIVRAVLHLVLLAAFLLGFTSVMLRQNKTLGLLGMSLVLIAALLGGSRVALDNSLRSDYYLGLDYALLLLIVYSLVMIPLEKVFMRREQGGVFRKDWALDLTYFFVSTMLVQVTTYLSLQPAYVLFNWAVFPDVQTVVRAQPVFVQILEIMLLADLMQYWVHRLFHVIAWLWKFHAIHHSTEVMDWMAGNRMHLVDLALTRSMVFVPAYVLGFADLAIYFYIVIVAVQSVFIHANLNWNFGWLEYVLTTPRFHHWHHAMEREATDKNFAIHFPALDILFGSFYLPPGNRWPGSYGVHSSDVPGNYFAQWVYPFLPSPKPAPLPAAVAASVDENGNSSSSREIS